MLYFHCQQLLEWTWGIRTHPEDTADQLKIVGKLVISSYTGHDVQSTPVNTSWQGALGYVELETMAIPDEGLG